MGFGPAQVVASRIHHAKADVIAASRGQPCGVGQSALIVEQQRRLAPYIKRSPKPSGGEGPGEGSSQEITTK